jgi:hypothetical protein
MAIQRSGSAAAATRAASVNSATSLDAAPARAGTSTGAAGVNAIAANMIPTLAACHRRIALRRGMPASTHANQGPPVVPTWFNTQVSGRVRQALAIGAASRGRGAETPREG